MEGAVGAHENEEGGIAMATETTGKRVEGEGRSRTAEVPEHMDVNFDTLREGYVTQSLETTAEHGKEYSTIDSISHLPFGGALTIIPET